MKMSPLRKVLVPLDGSPLAERALGHLSYFDLSSAEVQLLMVRHAPPPVWSELDLDVHIPDPDSNQPRALEYLESLATALRAGGLRVSLDSPRGDIAGIILERAEDCDLIVMTSRGRTGLKRWLYGSVAEKVVRYAPCPVHILGGRALD